MSEITTIDARGLSCPEPAMMTKKALRNAESGRVELLVDADPRDNCRRVAELSGWTVEIEELPGQEFRLIITK